MKAEGPCTKNPGGQPPLRPLTLLAVHFAYSSCIYFLSHLDGDPEPVRTSRQTDAEKAVKFALPITIQSRPSTVPCELVAFILIGPTDLRMGRAPGKPVASNTENRQLEVTG
jgi:hypothetical protein